MRQPLLLLIGGEGQEARPQTRVAVLMRLCSYRKSELWQEETIIGLLKRAADISKPTVFVSERGKPLHSSLYRWKQAIKTEMKNLKKKANQHKLDYSANKHKSDEEKLLIE